MTRLKLQGVLEKVAAGTVTAEDGVSAILSGGLLCEDVFGFNHAAVNVLSRLVAEAWDPERKNDIVARMRAKGVELVEHQVFGDFDLALWYDQKGDYHAVSLNSGQEDPTALSGQAVRTKAQQLHWYESVAQLQKWVQRYGKILISSAYVERTDQYRRMLTRYFLIGEWDQHPGYGFFILPD